MTRNPLITAWSMFTVLPTPDVGVVTRDRSRAVVACLPWTGLGIGLIAGLAAALIHLAQGGAVLAGIAGLVIIQLVTGFMHLDGLADTADGLGSRKPSEQALAIMKRSDIGPMGVSAIVLVLAVDAAALIAPGMNLWRQLVVLASAPVVSRIAVLFATRIGLETARPGGFGALFASITKPLTIIWTLIAALALIVALTLCSQLPAGDILWWPVAHGVLACLVAWGFSLLWHRHLIKRLGGSTGDIFGSLIEMTQLVYLLSWALF